MDHGTTAAVMDRVIKAFSGVTVLHDGHLTLRRGEIHALMGANGAGKSTLMKILTGVYRKDGGEIRVADDAGRLAEVAFDSPRDAQRAGIGIVHQELTLVESMSIADNVGLGREPVTAAGLLVDRRRGRDFARSALRRVGLDLDPDRLVETLPPARKQLVEIGRALAYDAHVLILDEPTTSLSNAEARNLLAVLRGLRDEGVAIVYISHRIDEIFAVTDRITVMRDGRFVATLDTSTTDRRSLIRLMIGRTLEAYERETTDEATGHSEQVEARLVHVAPALEVRNLCNRRLRDVSFEVRAAEVVGLFGLVGAGRTELAEAIFGVDRYATGSVRVTGRVLPANDPTAAADHGLALVPEDRKTHGLVLDLPLARNLELATLRAGSVLREGHRIGRALWERYSAALGIVARGDEQITRTLSGGNQQKLVLAKWLATSPKVLILDEPTRGVDVAAKRDIYALIRQLAGQGMAVLVISSESEEIRMLSDRVVVMREGAVAHDGPNTLDDEALLNHAMGGPR